MAPPTPPPSEELDVSALSGLFRSTTSSYKFLFFHALLDEIGQLPPSAEFVRAPALVERMLSLAWFPALHCKLQFGPQDRMTGWLTRARAYAERRSYPLESAEYVNPDPMLRAFLDDEPEVVTEAARYVPFRLLAPFFARKLRGVPDHRRNARIAELSRQSFGLGAAPYCFEDRGEWIALRLHPGWLAYLRRHHGILLGWCRWHWCRYMQTRNPNTPNVAGKLLRPEVRGSLRAQTDFWLRRLEEAGLRCPYSGLELTRDAVALDHVLPWSYVAHDELWNLVPAHPSANASKGKRLPDPSYLPTIAAMQADALAAERASKSAAAWRNIASVYVTGIELPPDLLAAPEPDLRAGVRAAYQRVLPPLVEMAAVQGFERGWTWSHVA